MLRSGSASVHGKAEAQTVLPTACRVLTFEYEGLSEGAPAKTDAMMRNSSEIQVKAGDMSSKE
jgi:hypothetical protein